MENSWELSLPTTQEIRVVWVCLRPGLDRKVQRSRLLRTFLDDLPTPRTRRPGPNLRWKSDEPTAVKKEVAS